MVFFFCFYPTKQVDSYECFKWQCSSLLHERVHVKKLLHGKFYKVPLTIRRNESSWKRWLIPGVGQGTFQVSQGHLVPVDKEVMGICHRDTEAAWGAPTGHMWDNLRIIKKKNSGCSRWINKRLSINVSEHKKKRMRRLFQMKIYWSWLVQSGKCHTFRKVGSKYIKIQQV